MRSRHSRRPLWLGGAALIAAVAIVLGIAQPWRSGAPPSHPSTAEGVHATGFQRALYSGAILDSSGHLDVDATLNRVVQAHANTYYYLIWDRLPRESSTTPQPSATLSADLWRKLPIFAAAAARRGINIVVYLVPPTESQPATYRPYGWDYAAWFAAIGRVAAKNRNIVGIAMDDLAANFSSVPEPKKITPEYLAQWRAAARQSAPWIKVYAVLYARDILGPGGIISAVRQAVDGLIYPFAGPNQVRGAARNTTDPNGLAQSVARVRGVTSCAGQKKCTEFVLARVSGGASAAPVAGSSTIRTTADTRSVKIRFADDRVVPSQGAYSIQVLLDGHTLAAERDSEGSTGHVAVYKVPAHLQPGDHQIKVVVTRKSGTDRIVVVIQTITTSGGMATVAAPLRVTSGANGNEVVSPLALEVMYYCARFTAEASRPGAADAAYVSRLVPQLQSITKAGLADGLVAYRLNLSPSRPSLYAGDIRDYGVVQRLYQQLAQRAGSD